LKEFINLEVTETENAGTLFRSNSMVSKMFKFYSRLIGLPYLYITIGKSINQLIFDNLGLEVDPDKMTEDQDLDEMRWMLMAQSQKILKAITVGAKSCPVQFRIICKEIHESVSKRFPDAVHKTIGGIMFLRYFCPGITSPESYGIVDTPTPNARRLLILITKVLQNLSNDVEFGSKEPYMAKMNDFIQSNRDKIKTFFDEISKVTSTDFTPAKMPKEFKEDSLIQLSNHCQTLVEKIEDQDLVQKLKQCWSQQ